MDRPFCSEQYQRRTAGGASGLECCLCGRETDGSRLVPVNHETGEFVPDGTEGDAISGYPIGPECWKKWRRAVAHTDPASN